MKEGKRLGEGSEGRDCGVNGVCICSLAGFFRQAGVSFAGLCYSTRGVVFASWLGRGNLL